jgi:hypothetical protein
VKISDQIDHRKLRNDRAFTQKQIVELFGKMTSPNNSKKRSPSVGATLSIQFSLVPQLVEAGDRRAESASSTKDIHRVSR